MLGYIFEADFAHVRAPILAVLYIAANSGHAFYHVDIPPRVCLLASLVETFRYAQSDAKGSMNCSRVRLGGDLLVQRRSCKCLVIALHRERWVLQLKIATWCKVIEDLLHNGTIVLEASHNRTCVDIVEGFAEDPVFFGIVDLEMTVCRDARCELEIVT